jgi:putative tryptophan/tyrosine transport system substrate-binding protein
MCGTTICLALGALLLALSFPAKAQQTKKLYRIGYLSNAPGIESPQEAFRQRLRELGYIEGENLVIEWRFSKGKLDLNPDLAAELVRLKVDIIVADSTGMALALKKATSTIPIVMTTVTDPVGTGLVASLARPGGNVTGLTSISGELGGKLLELLKEIVPRLNRVAILRPAGAANDLFVKETEPSARALGVKLIPLVFQGPEDFEDAFRSATKERANGLISRLRPGASSADRKRVVELAMKNRLPSISNVTSWAVAGGLMSYGSDSDVSYRRAAVYVDKILKGAKPSDLPVEAPTKFELVINLKTAKQIGLTIPPNVLTRADRVIR